MSSNTEQEFERWTGGVSAITHQMAGLVLQSRPGIAGWTREVAVVVADLRDMNRRTEGDFLAVGENLMTFLSAAREIRAVIGHFTDHISGESGERACQALDAVLALSSETQHSVLETNRALAGLRHSAARIQKGFARFDDVVLSFQVVATLGRIETARLGNLESDLPQLADQVRSCNEKVHTRVEHALHVAGGLERCLDQTLQRVSKLDFQQLETLPAIVGEVEQSLQAFRLRQQQAATTSRGLAEEFESFCKAIGNLVIAVQSHDITRQRVEHVIESLEHVLDESARTPGPSPKEIAVIDLQCRQLVGASQAFAGSVETIKQELQKIATQGRRMDGEAKALLGFAAEAGQDSFFGQMERAFAGVLTAVSNSADLCTRTTTAAVELQQIGDSLQSCLQEIRAICLEINYLAINSMVRAVHLGTAGEVIGVLAGAIRSVYKDAEERSEKTEEPLASLMEAIFAMARSAPPVMTGNKGNAPVVQDLQNTIVDLHDSSERSLACGKQISAAAANLCERVQTALNGFTVGELFGERIGHCCAILQKITGEPNLGPARPIGGLQHLAERYTMREERETHELAIAANAPYESPSERYRPAAPVPQTADLGENVELF